MLLQSTLVYYNSKLSKLNSMLRLRERFQVRIPIDIACDRDYLDMFLYNLFELGSWKDKIILSLIEVNESPISLYKQLITCGPHNHFVENVMLDIPPAHDRHPEIPFVWVSPSKNVSKSHTILRSLIDARDKPINGENILTLFALIITNNAKFICCSLSKHNEEPWLYEISETIDEYKYIEVYTDTQLFHNILVYARML